MSSVEGRVASVLYDHEWNQNGDDKCACGWTQDVVDHVVHQAQALADAGLLARKPPSRDEVHDAIWDAGLSRFLGVTDVERDVDAATDAVVALLRGESNGD